MQPRKRQIILADLSIQTVRGEKAKITTIEELKIITVGETVAEVSELMRLDDRKHLSNRIITRLSLKEVDSFKITKLKIISKHGLTTYKI